MKKNKLILALLIVSSLSAQKRSIPADTIVSTNHTTKIKGQTVAYQAQTGTQPVWNDKGEPIATLFYTYYHRTDVKNGSQRPLIFSFNGGPGSASVWMHVAYTGPKILNIDDEGYPVQPYGYKSNPNSILDVADIVFINPVNTGYSRMLENNGEMPDKKQFFGINGGYARKLVSDFGKLQRLGPDAKTHRSLPEDYNKLKVYSNL